MKTTTAMDRERSANLIAPQKCPNKFLLHIVNLIECRFEQGELLLYTGAVKLLDICFNEKKNSIVSLLELSILINLNIFETFIRKISLFAIYIHIHLREKCIIKFKLKLNLFLMLYKKIHKLISFKYCYRQMCWHEKKINFK